MSSRSASLTVLPLPAFADNYLWLLSQGEDAWVVDPGDEAVVEAGLHRHGLRLAGILLTHHHADHTAGAAALQQRWQCPVYAPVSAHSAYQPCKSLRVSDGDTLDLAPLIGLRCVVLSLPGHTLDHVAYLVTCATLAQPAPHGQTHQAEGDELHLFSGDVIFGAGCGRLFEGSPAQMFATLQRIARMPKHTLIYPAHEYTQHNLAFALTVDSTNAALQTRVRDTAALRQQGIPSLPCQLAQELATNPFLRCDVLAQTPAFAGQSPLQVFTELRARRNVF